MRTLGWITTGVVGAVAVLGVVLGVRSVPDVRRYVRIRAM